MSQPFFPPHSSEPSFSTESFICCGFSVVVILNVVEGAGDGGTGVGFVGARAQATNGISGKIGQLRTSTWGWVEHKGLRRHQKGGYRKRLTQTAPHFSRRLFGLWRVGYSVAECRAAGVTEATMACSFSHREASPAPCEDKFSFWGGFCGIIRPFCFALVSCPPWRKFSSRGLIFFGNVAPVLWCFC